MYLLRPDLDDLVDWLNAEAAVAWTVPDGDAGRWRAVKAVDADLVASRWRSGLWFVESVLQTEDATGEAVLVEDPFAGWTEPPIPASGQPRELPGGPTSTWCFRLEQRVAMDPNGGLSRSAFQWIGGHYSILGHKPAAHESAWWQRLRRHVKNVAEPRSGTSARSTAWVFPAAAEAVAGGLPFSKWS